MRDRHQHALDVVTHLVMREVHLRYRRSLLGWMWVLAQPLARFAVLAFVFTRMLPLDVPNYSVFLFSGLIGWLWFSSGLVSATASAVERRDLLMRPGIPRLLIPVVSVLTDATDYIAALPVLVVILLFSGGVPLTWLLLPVVMLPMFMLILGLGYAFCAANVYLRDVKILVTVATLLGFYVTPVFYPAEQVPEQYQWLLDLNPVAILLDLQRAVLVDGIVPDLTQLALIFAISGGVLFVGTAIYQRASRNFVDEL